MTTNLTSIGGPASGQVTEGIVQELDIERRKVLFEWHSLDHVGLDESYRTTPDTSGNIDYFHLNSIGVDADGNLLVSARHTSTIYKLDRKTGNDHLAPRREKQRLPARARGNVHVPARRPPPRRRDVHALRQRRDRPGSLDVEPVSRPIRLRLDTGAMTATLLRSTSRRHRVLATALGNLQQQPNGGVFVGWGAAGAFSEFAPDGTRLFDAASRRARSYRAYRFPWTASPATKPTAAAANHGNGQMTVYASWNGATQVASWQLNAGLRQASARRRDEQRTDGIRDCDHRPGRQVRLGHRARKRGPSAWLVGHDPADGAARCLRAKRRGSGISP